MKEEFVFSNQLLTIEIKETEAAFLLEYAERISCKDEFVSNAERIVFRRFICILEKAVTITFNANYKQILEAAKLEIEEAGA